MIKQRGKKLGLIAAAGLISLALMATPARAQHGADIVVPVVTAFALGALWQHGHHRHHGHYSRHSYHYKRHGYSRKSYSRHGQYRKGHGHHGQQYRNSSSRGGYSGSKRHH